MKSWILKILGGILVIGIPIIWQVMSSSIYLTIDFSEKSSLIEIHEDPISSRISILLDNHPINNLVKYKFTLKNTGFTPITEKDIVTNFNIQFPENSNLLFGDIIKDSEAAQKSSLTIDKNIISIEFGLLNPQEHLTFFAYSSSNADPEKYSVRLIGSTNLTIKDSRPAIEEKSIFTWKTYLAFSFLAFWVLLVLGTIKERKQHKQTRKLISENPDLIDSLSTQEEFDNFISNHMSDFPQSKEKQELQEMIDSFDDSPKYRNDFKSHLRKLIIERGGAENVFIMSIVFILITIIYIASYFL